MRSVFLKPLEWINELNCSERKIDGKIERFTTYTCNYNKYKVIDVTGIFMMNFPLLVNWPGRVFEEGEQYGGRSQN